jgi:hypothetical protein
MAALLFHKMGRFDPVKGTIILVLASALVTAPARRTFAAAIYTGSWSLSANNYSQIFGDGQTLTSLTSQVVQSKELGDPTGSYAKCEISLSAHPGHIHIFADTIGALGVNYNGTHAGSTAQAFFTLSDNLHLITPPSTHATRMTSFWQVDGLLYNLADGERSVGNTPADLLNGQIRVQDFVDVAAESSLRITGSGLPAAPAAAAHDLDSTTWLSMNK